MVASTITLPQALKDAFKGGYANSGDARQFDYDAIWATTSPRSGGNSGSSTARLAIALVVTVGGLVIFRVADNQSTKKFISHWWAASPTTWHPFPWRRVAGQLQVNRIGSITSTN